MLILWFVLQLYILLEIYLCILLAIYTELSDQILIVVIYQPDTLNYATVLKIYNSGLNCWILGVV